MIRVCLLALCALSGCVAISKVQISEIQRLEIDIEPPQIVEGKHLKRAFADATCHDDYKKWVHGKDAHVVLENGMRLNITGLSDVGHVIRFSNIQWCELSDKGWAALWKTP